MDFIRPELRAILWRWREVILLVGIIVCSTYMFIVGAGLVRVITIGLIIIGLAFVYPAIRQARATSPVVSVGVVEITERRIRYMGPETGSEISANDLNMVQIESRDEKDPNRDVTWIFEDIYGGSMAIPSGAQGARALLDAVSSLPGADLDAVVRAMGYPQRNLFTIWKKQN